MGTRRGSEEDVKRGNREEVSALWKPRRVILKPAAFIEMTLAATEIYRRECLGFLLGYALNYLVLVEHAIPFQSARRGYLWTEVSESRIARVRELSTHFGLELQLLGDFHSHAQRGKTHRSVRPSSEDVADMLPNRIYMILSVNETLLKKPWHRVKGRKSLLGTLGNFEVEVAVYQLVAANQYRIVEIVAPWSVGV